MNDETSNQSWVCLDQPRVCLGMHWDAASSAASDSIENDGSALGNHSNNGVILGILEQ